MPVAVDDVIRAMAISTVPTAATAKLFLIRWKLDPVSFNAYR